MTSALARCAVVLLTAVWSGCAPQPAGPVLPTGIAQLRLPMDGAALRRIAAEEEARGDLARRREVLAGVNRQLLMPPPDDVFAPELFDFVVALAPRMESGTVSPAWGSYLYTTYQRALREERPDGRPRRSAAEIEPVLDGYVEFFQIRFDPRGQQRPDPAADGFEAVREWRDEQRLGR
jgi:hypothetical protein